MRMSIDGVHLTAVIVMALHTEVYGTSYTLAVDHSPSCL